MMSPAFSDALRMAVMRAPCSDAVVAEVLLHLADEHVVLAAVDRDRRVDLGQLVGEDGLDHDALDLLDPTDVLLVSSCSHD